MSSTTLAIQKRLKELGYDPGPLDGIPGRQTSSAIAHFQSDTMVGIRWPGTVGPRTMLALFPDGVPPDPTSIYPPWVELGLRKKGLQEDRDKPELSKFLKSDGRTIGDPSKLPWCGDFVETCIAVSLSFETVPPNPYLARNWMQFGIETEPRAGAVMVFWRGTKSGIMGHVAFAIGQSAKLFYVLGGNQSDGVSIAPIVKTRLLGARWPKTFAIPVTVHLPGMVGGKISTNEE